jgi:hypothetical protein
VLGALVSFWGIAQLVSGCALEDATLGALDGVPSPGEGGSGGQGDLGWAGDSGTCSPDSAPLVLRGARADVVFVVENTLPLVDAVTALEDTLGPFYERLRASGDDPRIALVSCLGSTCNRLNLDLGLCVPPPLGAEDGCFGLAPDDSNPPRYTRVNQSVGASAALSVLVESADTWNAALREGTTRHLVLLSEGGGARRAEDVLSGLLGQGVEDFVVHALVPDCENADLLDPCCQLRGRNSSAAYSELVARTGGVQGNLCQDGVPEAIERVNLAIEAQTRIACEWSFPEALRGLDADTWSVALKDGDRPIRIGRVEAERCQDVQHAFFVDDPADPTRVRLCPQTCAWLQGRAAAELVLEGGCAAEPAEPA